MAKESAKESVEREGTNNMRRDKRENVRGRRDGGELRVEGGEKWNADPKSCRFWPSLARRKKKSAQLRSALVESFRSTFFLVQGTSPNPTSSNPTSSNPTSPNAMSRIRSLVPDLHLPLH